MPGEDFDDVVGDLTTTIEALVDDRSLLICLRHEVAIEAGKSTFAGIRQIDVSKFATRELVDLALVRFNPIDVAQHSFGCERNDVDVATVGAIRSGNVQQRDFA